MKTAQTDKLPFEPGPFEPTPESLKTWKCPDWFRDAKLGFWAHWGPQCVPMYGDWYARGMYEEGSDPYRFHCRTYGHPSLFGYKDIAKQWKAERFDPEALIDLYKNAGAKYFVALAVHHDNFDCWNSRHHGWNSVKVGPGKDIVGLWREAARRAGLRFGVTEHLERSWSWFNTNKGADRHGPYAGKPYDGNDPAFEDFYFPPHGDQSFGYPDYPPEAWVRQWYARIADLVEQHEPDLLYTDGGIPFGAVGRQLVAHFYNLAARRNGGGGDAVFTHKNYQGVFALNHGEYIEGAGVLDVERGGIAGINPTPWQTDTCIGHWYYDRRAVYKTAAEIVPMLADIVSKNGNLLLNVPLRPDGSLDDESRYVVQGLRDWIRLHGEAVFGTRPWRVFGEGPTQMGGGHFDEKAREWTESDFRFTLRPGGAKGGAGDAVYAFVMKWPRAGISKIQSFGTESPSRVRNVSLVGSDTPVPWRREPAGLLVTLPDKSVREPVSVLRIELAQAS